MVSSWKQREMNGYKLFLSSLNNKARDTKHRKYVQSIFVFVLLFMMMLIQFLVRFIYWWDLHVGQLRKMFKQDRKKTKFGPMKMRHHIISLEQMHLRPTHFLFSTMAQSRALHRAFVLPSATKLEAVPSYSICSISEVVTALWRISDTSAGDKADWPPATAPHCPVEIQTSF